MRITEMVETEQANFNLLMVIRCGSDRTCDGRETNLVSVVVANSCEYGESCRSSSS